MRFETFLLPTLRFLSSHPRVSRTVFAFDSWGDPFSRDAAADPFPMIQRMWQDGPVTHRRAYGQWFVRGYDECQQILASSDATLGDQLDGFFDEVSPHRKLSDETKTFFRNWMLLQDGETHARLRGLVSRAFTPRQIAAWQPHVERAVRALIADLEGEQRFEAVEAFNRPLPVNVISSIMGIPCERWPWVGRIVTDMATFLDPLNSFDIDRIDSAGADFREYVLELASERRRDPRDDLITVLAQAEHDGSRLTEDELVAHVGLLVFAGQDTTTNMLGNSLVALARNPDQRAMIRERPDLWPNAVEELLRFDNTAFAILRTLHEDMKLGETVIPEGSSVVLQLLAANRDPRRWDVPDQLRLDRENPRPLAFGHGIHHCLGNALARLELRVALAALIDWLGDYEIDEEALEWRLSVVLRGPSRLVISRR